ncbi:hypothetical protein GGH91_000631 [Coemansia sp. RSA 2671]|nr:hypothetical protein LPJ60_000610 [Coemansia sp. RSA 2675]KAJ2349733.1 hypothetical protein GGH91_000631 [Coemansia sp. RSA 2671]
MIAADLEARLLRAARAKGRINSSRGKRRNDSPLDTWALDILEWTESQPLPLSNESNESDGGGDSDKSDESLYSGDFEPIGIYSDYVATCFESFMLFQSILSLENSRTGRSPLEDAESLFYLARILGTFGINREQRAEFVADPDMSILD